MKLSLVLKYLLLLGWLVFAINEQLYAQTPKLTKDEKAISKHFSEIKKRMGVAGLSLTIHSIAECKGPDGAYVTKVESSEGHLTFKQQFSYRDEPVELKINGDEGVDAEGESISEFMIFFGRMHDYVRIALQPEYLFQEIDSVIQKKDEIKFFGSAGSGYSTEYITNADHKPLKYSLNSDDNQTITTIFDSWTSTKEGIRVPELIRIIDGEKVFTFKYSEITVQIEER